MTATGSPGIAGLAIRVAGVSKRFGDVAALSDVSFDVEANTVCGLLGRNGAGKTTLMQILTGQNWQSAGRVEIFGRPPFENEDVLRETCFIRESQRYPDVSVRAVLQAGALLYPNWDAELADDLLAAFGLPLRRRVKKLSRGMLSAVGVILGLASRARLTLFDEPYLGLDAVARQLFYDRLLSDVSEHPRTVLLSTHLIDEVSDLLEHVVLIDDGRVLLAGPADDLRGRAVTVTGPTQALDRFAAPHQELHRERLGGVSRVTVTGGLTSADHALAAELGLEIEPVSLQQLVVRTTTQKMEAAR